MSTMIEGMKGERRRKLMDKRVRIHWRDNLTHKEGIYEEPKGRDFGSITKDEDGYNCFMWDEGNYACDCNRLLFFIDPNDLRDLACSEWRFDILKLEAADLNEDNWVDTGYHEAHSIES